MKAGTLVSIVKRSESANPIFRAANWETFTPGIYNPTASLPVDYEILGFLVEDIRVGKPVVLLRVARNGERVLGYYQSTTVLELREDAYVTMNSVYSVKTVCTHS